MMIGKTRTNIRAEIDTQHEILSQLIYDISTHYQTVYNRINKEVEDIIKEYEREDYDIYSSLSQSYNEVTDKSYSLCIEARKILFCAIFSYLESMLYGIIAYYRIPSGKTNQVGQLIDIISKEYYKRESKPLLIHSDINIICDFYRPLRNSFMHGRTNSEKDKKNLQQNVDLSKGVSVIENKYEIYSNEFFEKTLHNIYTFLLEIEEAYYGINVKSK